MVQRGKRQEYDVRGGATLLYFPVLSCASACVHRSGFGRQTGFERQTDAEAVDCRLWVQCCAVLPPTPRASLLALNVYTAPKGKVPRTSTSANRHRPA